MSVPVSMIELKAGENGTVATIKGGAGMVRKLDSLGIHEGKTITKISAQWMHGPVVIRAGATEVAIGYGMASKIMVLS
ncbi:MAG: ferrous iron transport protein A [Chitinispirillaceae bacterium]|nr:ferrous iron transport protein A [Chitinispirillaceae bacterium]